MLLLIGENAIEWRIVNIIVEKLEVRRGQIEKI